jgi:hypothetical protein
MLIDAPAPDHLLIAGDGFFLVSILRDKGMLFIDGFAFLPRTARRNRCQEDSSTQSRGPSAIPCVAEGGKQRRGSSSTREPERAI